MRTALDFEQLSAVVADYFKRQGSDVAWMQFDIDENGALTSCVIEHDTWVELPTMKRN